VSFSYKNLVQLKKACEQARACKHQVCHPNIQLNMPQCQTQTKFVCFISKNDKPNRFILIIAAAAQTK
jgi:hypothetical protein